MTDREYRLTQQEKLQHRIAELETENERLRKELDAIEYAQNLQARTEHRGLSMTNSRQKGKRGELGACAAIWEHLRLKVRRSQQYCGSEGDADLEGLEGIAIEVKCRERVSIVKWVKQAIADAKGRIPVVIHKVNRGDWLVTVRLSELKALATALQLNSELQSGDSPAPLSDSEPSREISITSE